MSIINFIKSCALLTLFQIVRWAFGLRYRVSVKGLEAIEPSKSTLVLPNHPAEIDPVIVTLALWKKLRPRPLVVENFYYLKGFRVLMDWVGALPFPNFDTATSKWKARQVDKVFDKVVEDIRAGENFLIYPAGKLKLTGLELVGGASFVPNLLQACPDTQIVLVRTRGLWGSRFSRALTGRVPNFTEMVWEGIKILFANGIFFAPRREVVLEVEKVGSAFPSDGSRMEINRFLEAWYNKDGPEPLNLVSERFWKESFPSVKTPHQDHKVSYLTVPAEVEEEILFFVASLCRMPKETITREMNFSYDLGLDSLDVAQLYLFLDEKFDVSGVPHGHLHTVEDLMRAAVGYRKQDAKAVKKEKGKWFLEKDRPSPALADAETIPEAFLKSCTRMGHHIACTDHITGPLSYKRLKQAALVLSLKIRVVPGEYVGILFPSSTAAYLVILATLLAKKVPVMLNWTTGVRALNHAVGLTQLETVISSRRFLDKLEQGDLGDVDPRLVFLEEMKDRISWLDKLRGGVLSFYSTSRLLKKLRLDTVLSSKVAAVIFTSGTESLPKGVPLSHQNILSNQRAALERVCLLPTDVLYGVLPPFHSFGFSATGLLPLLTGLKVCYAPDPTDSHGMASDIACWRPTLLICAPGFIRSLFRVALPKQVESLRLVVSGAERAPPEFFQTIKKVVPHAEVLEGYGITECAPIVTLKRPGVEQNGVGEPISNVTLCAVDPATGQLLPKGEEGEVCIAGPNVFAGYLGGKPNPFLEAEGKLWYRSGDRGYVDSEGSLVLSGRLKRFVKMGGEMVSLGGIEEELIHAAKASGWGGADMEEPFLAVSVKEKEGEKPLIVVYAKFNISKDEMNAALFAKGFGPLAKVGEVRQVKEIPLTGTGKVHHRLLDDNF